MITLLPGASSAESLPSMLTQHAACWLQADDRWLQRERRSGGGASRVKSERKVTRALHGCVWLHGVVVMLTCTPRCADVGCGRLVAAAAAVAAAAPAARAAVDSAGLGQR